MAVNFTVPTITGNTTDEKLRSLHSWLFQFTEQMQYAINNLDTSNFAPTTITKIVKAESTASSSSQNTTAEFEALRSLVKKTADTVQASYDELSKTLKSNYVATSVFGKYVEEATNNIALNADGITQNFKRYEEASKSLSSVETSFNKYVKETNAYIRTGYLDQLDAYGVAIGEERVEYDENNNEYVYFDQFATLTSDELSFWASGVKLGYFKGDSLVVNGAIRIGAWSIDPSGGLAIKYVNGGD